MENPHFYKCEKLVGSVNANEITVNSGTHSWVGTTYNCAFCFTVLSVAIDPVALKTDTVDEVVRALTNKPLISSLD
jgi:hypothetical protein